jgi:membrane-bound lytic murein transglycosylase D
MKFFAASVILLTSAVSSGQTPQVPHKIHFAGMTLAIRDDARTEIQKDVDALTRSSKYFGIKIERARTYFPIIEQIFTEEKVPQELKFLVLQESALIADAVSVSNAVGFWQFKEATAKDFGLKVNALVDERMNIVSATRGAARYFKHSNNYFNNWLLVVQSYQMGIGGTMRLIGDVHNGSRHMEITSDTYWYVKKFLAHIIAFEHAWKGKGQVAVTPVLVNKQTSLEALAKNVDVDLDKLKEFNKWSRGGQIPGDQNYFLIVPRGDLNGFVDELPVAVAAKPVETVKPVVQSSPEPTSINGIDVIRARRGESLADLADRGNISVKKLIRWNDLTPDDLPIEGHVYYLKPKYKTLPAGSYVSKGKENMWELSQSLGVKLSYLKKLNPQLKPDALQPGTRVVLSVKNKITPKKSGPVAVDPSTPFEWSSGQN